jgi:hypothetical protein
MYTVKQGGVIQKGDLVAIANGNDFSVGIYFGQGRGGTVQYFTPRNVVQSREWWENAQKDNVSKMYAESGKPWKLTRVWKHYVNTPRDTRILKLNRENITDRQTIEDIEKAKEILQEFNIPVNY